MINAILKGVLSLVTSLLTIFLSPINTIINNYLPDFSEFLTKVSQFFTTFSSKIGWVLDSLFIEPETVSFLISVLIIRLTVPYLLSAIKLVVKWWRSIKL